MREKKSGKCCDILLVSVMNLREIVEGYDRKLKPAGSLLIKKEKNVKVELGERFIKVLRKKKI